MYLKICFSRISLSLTNRCEILQAPWYGILQGPTDISGGKLHQIRINWQSIMPHALGNVLEGMVQRIDERIKLELRYAGLYKTKPRTKED